MTEREGSDHLAIMARSGLMTHVAELDPPFTAASMARFRAEVSAQATNIMALSSGSFALSLPPNTLEVRTSVPHRLRPISETGETGAPNAIDGRRGYDAPEATDARVRRPDEAPHYRNSAQSGSVGAADLTPAEPSQALEAGAAPAPRRILPPSMRANPLAEQGLRPQIQPAGPAPSPLDAPMAGIETALTAVSDTQSHVAAQLADLQTRLAAHEDRLKLHQQVVTADLDATHQRLEARLCALMDDRLEAMASRIGAAFSSDISRLSAQHGRAQADADAAMQAAEGRQTARLEASEQRLAEAIAVADSAGQSAFAELRKDVEMIALSQAEDETRMSEGFATIRLGLRGFNERLSDLAATLAYAHHAPLPHTLPSSGELDSATQARATPGRPGTDPKPTSVARLPPPDPEKPRESADQLRSLLETVLADLGGMPDHPKPGSTTRSAPPKGQAV